MALLLTIKHAQWPVMRHESTEAGIGYGSAIPILLGIILRREMMVFQRWHNGRFYEFDTEVVARESYCCTGAALGRKHNASCGSRINTQLDSADHADVSKRLSSINARFDLGCE